MIIMTILLLYKQFATDFIGLELIKFKNLSFTNEKL